MLIKSIIEVVLLIKSYKTLQKLSHILLDSNYKLQHILLGFYGIGQHIIELNFKVERNDNMVF